MPNQFKAVAKPVIKLAGILLLIAGAFYFGLHSGAVRPISSQPSGQQMPNGRAVRVDIPDAVVASRLIGESSAPDVLPSKSEIESMSFSVALEKCLMRSTSQSMEDFMELEIETTAVSKTLQFENLHFHLLDGSMRRLQIRPTQGETAHSDINSDSNPNLEVKAFSVDHEDLPVPQKIPPQILSLPFARQIHALSEGREPLFSQRREFIKLRDSSGIDVEWINNKVREFQWTGDHFVLSCRSQSCECRRD